MPILTVSILHFAVIVMNILYLSQRTVHKWIYSNLSSLEMYLWFCRGFVYCRNEELEPGWVVFSSGRLLHRPCSFDAKPYQLCQVVDLFTLQVLPFLNPLFNLILI